MPRRRWRTNRRGSVAIEMAVVLPFLMLTIYGIVEVGRLLYTVAALNYAVERASRCAVIDSADCGGAPPDTAQCYAAAWALGLGLGCGDVHPSTACAIPGSSTGGIQIAIDYAFQSPVLRLLGGGASLTIPLRAQSCFPQ